MAKKVRGWVMMKVPAHAKHAVNEIIERAKPIKPRKRPVRQYSDADVANARKTLQKFIEQTRPIIKYAKVIDTYRDYELTDDDARWADKEYSRVFGILGKLAQSIPPMDESF